MNKGGLGDDPPEQTDGHVRPQTDGHNPLPGEPTRESVKHEEPHPSTRPPG